MGPRTDPETPGALRPAGRTGAPGGARGARRADDQELGERLRQVARLLGDESAHVRAAVRSELLGAGRAGRARVRRATRSKDARVRGHARLLAVEIAREEVVRRLVRRVARGGLELEPALFTLGRLERPELDVRPYRKALDAMARSVRRRARGATDEAARAQALVDTLSGELGFAGEPGRYHHPDNVHLHRALERKRGLPLTLCAIYAAVARRAGIEAGLLPLPGHVVLRLRAGDRDLLVDPFHGGEPRTHAELMTYLARHGLTFESAWFRDADDASLFHRQVNNLANAWTRAGRAAQARALAPLLRALAARSG